MTRLAHDAELRFVAAAEKVFLQKVQPGAGINPVPEDPHYFDSVLTVYGQRLVAAMLEIAGINGIVIEEGFVEKTEPHDHFYQFRFKIDPSSINDRFNLFHQILTCFDALSIATCG